MIDWKQEAIDTLTTLRIKEIAVENLPGEIDSIRFDMEKTEQAVRDGLPRSKVIDVQMSRSLMIKALEKNLSATEQAVSRIRAALAELHEEDRKLLEMMYIQKERKTMNELCDVFGYSKATMYRKKDTALMDFADALWEL